MAAPYANARDPSATPRAARRAERPAVVPRAATIPSPAFRAPRSSSISPASTRPGSSTCSAARGAGVRRRARVQAAELARADVRTTPITELARDYAAIRVGVAVADLYPSCTVDGSAGFPVHRSGHAA